jgi:2-keto-4-pentenoate hydratase
MPASTDEPGTWLAAAQALRAQHRSRHRFGALSIQGQPLSAEQGYAVQAQHVAELRREFAGEVAGYKIGLTSAAMQQMCGIGHPVYGCVLESRVAQTIGTASLAAHGRLGIEFEIAARLGQDICLKPSDDALARVGQAVDAFAIALELVDDRQADYACIDAPSLIADNAWNAGVVLGPWKPASQALTQQAGEVFFSGQRLDHGCIGEGTAHPLASVAWLAQALGQQGQLLRRGMFVMTGSIVRTRFPDEPGHWRFSLAGLGSVGLDVVA